MIELTEELFTKAIHAAVETRGRDFVYKRPRDENGVGMCRYVTETGDPDCLIGLALTIIDRENGTHFTPDHDCLDGANTVLTRLGFPQEVIDAAQMAQWTQDGGTGTWGDAVNRYDKYLQNWHKNHEGRIPAWSAIHPVEVVTTDTAIQQGAV